ncbi:nucleolar and coiled-body phosphoprotein 1 isoform X2 [Corythoichthys intestinalis]|uniref:nucleolar and coiled-body phosphoprotein 1 isoform X2 n=1 Tax=Corythoichthys intestinalis TaxID=161448 RepID=UPI0025A50B6C|nr:nucleolar and coiled-body phosphoprotein 1 isoform X2 [Corythoichthys intestinalis]
MEPGDRYTRRITKRRLWYRTTKQDEPKGARLSLGDVDRMFEDYDYRECTPTPLQLSDSDSEEIQQVPRTTPLDLTAKPTGTPKEDLPRPATRTPGLELNNEGPTKTSSPLDENSDGNSPQFETNEEAKRLSPILFDHQEEGNTARNKPNSGVKLSQEEPSMSTSENGCEDVHMESTTKSLPHPVKKDIGAFLRKVLDSSQPKANPTTLTPVKMPTPLPELDDDYQILEDDVPIFFSIPSKSKTKERTNKKSISGKGNSMDKGSTDSLRETDVPSRKSIQDQKPRKKTKKSPRVHLDTPDNEKQENPHKMGEEQLKEADNQTENLKGMGKSTKNTIDNTKRSRSEAKSKETTVQHQQPSSEKDADPHPDQASPSVYDIGKYNSDQDLAAETIEHHQCSSGGLSPSEHQILGKRKRRPPGEWWVRCPQNVAKENSPRVKKPKSNRKEAAKAKKVPKSTTKKDVRVTQKKKIAQMEGPGNDVNSDEGEQMEDQDSSPRFFSPQIFPQEEQRPKSALQHTGNKKASNQPIRCTPTSEWLLDKRRTGLPRKCRELTSTPNDAQAEHCQLPSQIPKKSKESKPKKAKAKRSAIQRKSAGSAVVPKSVNSLKRAIPVNWDDNVPTPDVDMATFSAASKRSTQDRTFPSEDILCSGLDPLIDLHCHDDEDLPTTRNHLGELSVVDLCAPPLKPCTLRAKDRADLTEWLRFLFPTTVKENDNKNLANISPDYFDWYFHKSLVMGIAEDKRYGNVSVGKILLGSFMKKPLWVDHSADVVFFLMTSSVTFNMDCTEYRVHAGNFFMVPCGHAYSIHNLAPQPAVLCFTRMLTETPD